MQELTVDGANVRPDHTSRSYPVGQFSKRTSEAPRWSIVNLSRGKLFFKFNCITALTIFRLYRRFHHMQICLWHWLQWWQKPSTMPHSRHMHFDVPSNDAQLLRHLLRRKPCICHLMGVQQRLWLCCFDSCPVIIFLRETSGPRSELTDNVVLLRSRMHFSDTMTWTNTGVLRLLVQTRSTLLERSLEAVVEAVAVHLDLDDRGDWMRSCDWWNSSLTYCSVPALV